MRRLQLQYMQPNPSQPFSTHKTTCTVCVQPILSSTDYGLKHSMTSATMKPGCAMHATAAAAKQSLQTSSRSVLAQRQHPSHGQPAFRASATASNSDSPPSDGQTSKPLPEADQQYKYIGSNNRRHATMEDAWRVDPSDDDGQPGSSNFGGDNAPWGLGWQASERDLVWNDELRLGLLKKVAAAELGIGGDEIEQRIRILQQLLPDMIPRMSQMKANLLVKLASKTDTLGDRLMQLKLIFPRANVSLMVSRAPALALMEDLDPIRQGAAAFREMLPTADLDMIVQEHASVLDTGTFGEALKEAERLLPGMDIGNLLTKNPGMVLQFQRGSTMIPYDAVPGQKT